MGCVVTLTKTWTLFSKIKHYLFHCPTFWRIKPAFTCPICGHRYRCYWDGNDCGGKIDVCKKCTTHYEKHNSF